MCVCVRSSHEPIGLQPYPVIYYVVANLVRTWSDGQEKIRGTYYTKLHREQIRGKYYTKNENIQKRNNNTKCKAGRPGSSEVPRNPLTRLEREFGPGKRDFSH